MTTPEDILAAYWLLLFAVIVGVAFVIIAVIAAIDEIRVRYLRRRYRVARKV